MICNLCPRRCNTERSEYVNESGFCGMPLFPRLARAGLHFWEEPCISGKNGSGTVFFSGCSLRCIYCQNLEISHKNHGKTVSYERLAEIFKELEDKGAENINLVNPTHYTHAIKRALEIYKPNIPIVYNTGGYERTEIIDSFPADIYLFDLKYCDDKKSLEYSAASDYFSVAKDALLAAYRRVGAPRFNENGIMQSGIIVRHLLLPSSTNDAIKIIDWCEKNCPDVIFSLMAQYTPYGDAKQHKILGRRITKREYDKVLSYCENRNFFEIYVQELESATSDYIPAFNLEGV
ncbi:MAG: radical SAM protein [Clostridia bacterium]|nr:radical SAM protein [Clostridia bacterium]